MGLRGAKSWLLGAEYRRKAVEAQGKDVKSESIRRLPLVPTVIVLIAVAIMLRASASGTDRRHEKESEIARLAQNVSAAAIDFPVDRFHESQRVPSPRGSIAAIRASSP